MTATPAQRRRLRSQYARARAGLWLALLAVAVGVGWQATPALGLIVGGLLAAAVLLFATPVAEPDDDEATRR